jgi:pyrroloquinoline quinone biosynthesis protein D
MLRHDAVRSLDVVLLPERIIKLNPTAAAVLRLCDGSHAVRDIVAELQRRYHGPNLEGDVVALLGGLAKQGVFE